MDAKINIAASDDLVLIEASIGDQYIIDRIAPDAADALALRFIRCATIARERSAEWTEPPPEADPTAECFDCHAVHALTAIAANNDQCPSCGAQTIYF